MADDLRIEAGGSDPLGVTRPPPIEFTFDRRHHRAHPGETIAAALLAAGVRTLRTTRNQQGPRGIFCGIGMCFDCLVRVNGSGRPQRACVTNVHDGDQIESHTDV